MGFHYTNEENIETSIQNVAEENVAACTDIEVDTGNGVMTETDSLQQRIREKRVTVSDFQTTELYGVLYRISNRFEQQNMDISLGAIAEQLGGKKLLENYKKRKRAYFEQREEEKKKRLSELKERAGGMTKFSYLPEGICNLEVGMDWKADDTGIFFLGNRVETRACSHPITIRSIRICVDSLEQKVELLFWQNNKWKSVVVDKDILASSQKITALHKLGISVTSANAKQLVAYLQDLEDYSMKKGLIPIIHTTSRLGWNKNLDMFCPYTNENLAYDAKGRLSGLGKALQEKGSLEAWKKMMCKLRKRKIPMLSFLMAGNFAAVIIGMLRKDGFVCNLYGPSRGGKSVTNKIACSIWAGHTNSDGFIHSVDNTANAVEGILAVLHNIPLILEDANNLSERKQREMQSLIMKICNGIGKGRMRKDLSMAETSWWYTTGIITSENRIIKDCHNTGSVNRVLMLRGTNEKECPYNRDGLNASELLNFFEENHGFGGRAFVQAVMEIGEEKIKERLQEIREEVQRKVNETNKSEGQIEPVSVMLLADEIAEEHIFQDGIRISLDEAISWMADEKTANQNERFYDSLMDSVVQNSGKFENLGLTVDMNVQQYWGRYFNDEKGERVAVLPKVLKQLADEENLDMKLFLESLDEKGLLEKDADGNYTKNVYSRLLQKGTRMYVIYMKKRENQEAAPENEDIVQEEIPF